MRFLIVKTSSLGDIIHTFPALDYLRNKFSDAQIDWVVEKPFAEILISHPEVDEVIPVDTKRWRRKFCLKEMRKFTRMLRKQKYDAVFDLQGNIKSGLITFLAKSRKKVGFGWKTVPEKPNFLFTSKGYNPSPGQNIRDDYLLILQKHFNDQKPHTCQKIKLIISDKQRGKLKEILDHPQLQKSTTVMVCPGATWRNKRLPTEKLLIFLKRLHKQKRCGFIFVWGTEEERNTVQKLSDHFTDDSIILDKLPVPMVQNLMDAVDLVVTMDSLPLHLAGTTSTSTYSFFGASNATKYKPKGEQHKAIQGPCPYGRTFEKRCPILRSCSTGACIRDIKSADL